MEAAGGGFGGRQQPHYANQESGGGRGSRARAKERGRTGKETGGGAFITKYQPVLREEDPYIL